MNDICNLLLLSLLFFFPLLHIHFAAFFLSTSHAQQMIQHHQCLDDQRSALVQLQHDLLNHSTSSQNLWDLRKDCCSWEGVTCDAIGQVIGLDLSYKFLSGSFNSIFHLPHLRQLNLAGNRFGSIGITSGIENLGNLTHLNLSNSGFYGQVPIEISHLPKLESLDLSTLEELKLESPNLKTFIQNLTSLTQLYLDGVDLSAQGNSWCEVLSHGLPKLKSLSLVYCNLSGPVCSSISDLHFLSQLHLDGNRFSSSLPANFLANSSHLTSLTLSSCQLQGNFPKGVFLLPKLESIDISNNPLLTGQLPEFPFTSPIRSLSIYLTNFHGNLPDSIGNLKFLTNFKLHGCNFSGSIPSSIGNLTDLVTIVLPGNCSSNSSIGNCFSGSIPSSIGNLTNLVEINLSGNRFSGSIPLLHPDVATHLEYLDLSQNQLNGVVDSSLFSLPSLSWLYLQENRLAMVSELDISTNASSSVLNLLDLSDNNLGGIIPKSVFQFPKLETLFLDGNDLDKLDEVAFPMRPTLGIDNTNSGRPLFDISSTNLLYLNLANNKIRGRIPNWIWNGHLNQVDLSHNYIDAFEQFSPNVSWTSSLLLLDLHDNELQGSFPHVLCNFSGLLLLDASYNNFTGPIPNCMVNLENIVSLNLQQNNFEGELPDLAGAGKLRSLKINGNNLNGMALTSPMALKNCTSLEVLDIGNNMIQDSFPFWLKELPSLRVLILRGNKLHGDIEDLETFPVLHILDVSYNEFSGELSKKFVNSLVAMRSTSYDGSEPMYIGGESDNFNIDKKYYKESVTLVMKGSEVTLENILTIFTSLDLSNNRFNGKIPQGIGNLKSLKLLNLSGNNFIGRIPSSLGDLRELESLDLSRNQLSGEIPQQLTSLTFLAVMNLSYNQLEGLIPQGNQFNTFSNDSYQGNLRLCGLPLTRKCSEGRDPVSPPVEDEDSESIFDWKIVLMGYGCGLVIGFSIGYTVLDRMGHKWFTSLRRLERKRWRRFIQQRGIPRST